EYKCVIKGKILDTDFNLKGRKDVSPLVVGDKVEFIVVNGNEGIITSRLKRSNEFKRLKNNGREIQTLVANVDYLIIVDSIENPPLRTFFIDRCLFTADYMKIPVIIVFNKIDLLDDNNKEFYYYIKQVYEKLGYKTLETSVEKNTGIDEIKLILKDKISSFNGRSGVGKSSLIKILEPQYSDIKIGKINEKYDRGSHTTTFARIYKLSEGGYLADTPGIRELAIFIDKKDDVENYFRDFDKYRSKCRFPNCQHIDEPDCHVIKALEKGKIEEFRYESYLRMRETVLKLKDSRI
ncbi:MAG TPA: ribosome small subunit-dependent GTPase A, partial [Spirochaetota bacterium]|nr:ribosome small subunit-dependent GTPase A [Spirochaetota bacterium]